jgi:hypothetical protein
MANLGRTWATTQQTFVERFNVVWNEGQAIVVLWNIKQKNNESMEDYYDRLLHLYVVMQQCPTNMYFWGAFKEGLHRKLRMAILSIPKAMVT